MKASAKGESDDRLSPEDAKLLIKAIEDVEREEADQQDPQSLRPTQPS